MSKFIYTLKKISYHIDNFKFWLIWFSGELKELIRRLEEIELEEIDE